VSGEAESGVFLFRLVR